jgi:hypothetical protein
MAAFFIQVDKVLTPLLFYMVCLFIYFFAPTMLIVKDLFFDSNKLIAHYLTMGANVGYFLGDYTCGFQIVSLL